MPSPAKLCIFGDSHIGCLKFALKDKLVTPPKDISVEFWGASGPLFRDLNHVDGKIVPTSAALPSVLVINGNGQETLDPANYDAILFMAARTRSLNIFEPELHRMQQPDGYLSNAVFEQNCADWLRSQRLYIATKDFAQNSDCKIFIAPTTFLTQGAPEAKPQYLGSKITNAEGVDRIWSTLEKIAAEDNIALLRQPPETCGDGATSKPEYNRTNVDGTTDVTHRSPDYGALILERLFQELR